MIRSESKEMMENGNKNEGTKSKNMKNIYIQKIASMMGISRQNLLEAEVKNTQQQQLEIEAKRTRKNPSSNTLNNSVLNQQKLEKNRQSAKKARQRKKLYVKLLEKQVQRLKEIANEGKKIQEDTAEFMNRLRINITQITQKKQLFSLKPVIMNNMYNVTSCPNVAEQNIQSLINLYQLKIGPTAKQRFQSLDKYTQEIEQTYLPPHVQKILNSSQQSLLSQSNNLNQKQQSKGMYYNPNFKVILDKLKLEQGKLNQLFGNLRKEVGEAKNELRSLNKLIDEMREQFSAIEVCRFLVFIENEKNKQEVVRQFINHLREIEFNKIKKNDEELYNFIFKEDLKKMIFFNVKQTQDLIRRMSVYMSREIQRNIE